MTPIPRHPAPDATLALVRDPYGFIGRQCRELGSDVFEARLLLRRTLCLSGRDAAELFYDGERFERRGTLPRRLRKTLVGEGSVQGLDGAAHHDRKGMFLSVLGPQRIGGLVAATAGEWEAAAGRWASRDEIVLYDEAREVLCRAVCGWAGVPLDPAEVPRRTDQLTALFEGAGGLGPRHWRARRARKAADRWAAERIEAVRRGSLQPPAGSAVAVIAAHRDVEGEPLAPHTAGVELLNVLRPTVAVAVYIAFVAVALHRHPACRERLAAGEPGFADAFVQEVRRFYPFFPSVAARVRRDFEWQGHRFPRGRRAMLDLHGTDHDPRVWEAPEEFRPERFLDRQPGPFELIPQGGGDHGAGHRCAGEWTTIALMKDAADLLARRLDYVLPEQDLSIVTSRLPALPRSRVVLRGARLRPA